MGPIESASALDIDGSADADHPAKILRIPVGESKTAVALSASDLFGSRRAVNAVAGAVESDPRDTDRVIGAGRNHELVPDLFPFLRFGKDRRIEGVIGILDGDHHRQGADGAFLGYPANAHGKMCEEVAVAVVGAEISSSQADSNQGRLSGRRIFRVGYHQFGTGDDGIPTHPRIESLQQVGMRVCPFPEEFHQGRVAQPRDFGLPQPCVRDLPQRGKVLLGYDVPLERGANQQQRLFSIRVAASGFLDSLLILKCPQRRLGLGAGDTVQGARANAALGQGDLRFEEVGGRSGLKFRESLGCRDRNWRDCGRWIRGRTRGGRALGDGTRGRGYFNGRSIGRCGRCGDRRRGSGLCCGTGLRRLWRSDRSWKCGLR